MTLAAETSSLDLESLNPILARQDASKLVAWAAAEFQDEVVMSSSFGVDSAVLLHIVTRIVPRIKVIMIDTGFLFPVTFTFMEHLRRRLDLNVWVYRTRNDPFDYLARAGEGDPQRRSDITSCCAANKNEPFERAFRDLSPRAWLRGIRRDQSQTRQGVEVIEWARRYGCYAISPLVNWKQRDIDAYLQRHDLPRHPLADQGYLSVGCNPISCTQPVQLGADPRSGRWSGGAKLECGINHIDSLDSAKL